MFVKPRSAFVGKPSVVASSSGSAKKARYARLLPSTRKRSESRAGPSSSCSSAPVRVFGDTGRGYRPAPMALELMPFADEHLDEAAALLADAHGRQRAAEPLLPDAVDYRAQVEEEWRREGASGAVARRDGAVAGYLVGAPASNDNRGGTRIFSGLAGHATAEPELARDLFAAAAERWHDEGHTRFAVVAPSHDTALVDAWFRVGFGLQFAYAARETEALAAAGAGVTIRPGTPDDLVHLARFDRVLWELQARSPSFSNLELPDDDTFREDWADTWDEPGTFWSFMAERDGEVVGEALLYRRP